MATVSGMTAEAIEQIVAQMLTSARVDEQGQIIFKTRGGTEINAGAAIAPAVAIDKVYPVGAIFIGTTNENPGSLLGVGTWTRFGNGRALVGVDENDSDFNAPSKTGGAKTVKLTGGQMPRHYHSVQMSYNINPSASGSGAQRVSGIAFGTGEDLDRGGNTGNSGNDEAHPNLQPYITVYMWRRTA